MCGIVCYCGNRKAVPVLMEGLRRLEYRGYDSAGFAVIDNTQGLVVEKKKGKVNALEQSSINKHYDASMGIAHTRWSTHGEPTTINAHPHKDCTGKICVIHNGIIENYSILKEELVKAGHHFISDTDTEVIAHLIEQYYKDDLELAVLMAVERLNGTFGLAVMHEDVKDSLIIVRRGSPVILGVGDGEMFAASDTNALSNYTNRMIYLQDDDIAIVKKDSYLIKNLRSEIQEREIHELNEIEADVDKAGFEHFMLKEIFEQPESIKNAFRGRLIQSEGVSKLGGLEPVMERLKKIRKIILISCGTSYYAGLFGRYIFEHLTDINIDVELASEFRYRKLKIDEDTAVLAISQSGETADTLAALKEAKRKGALILGIVNVVGSTIARITDAGVYNFAGPEIGVASTKIYTSQLVILTLIGVLIGRYQGLSYIEGASLVAALKKVPKQVEEILKTAPLIEKIAKKYSKFNDFLYIGRLYNYPTALEAALKLKEISYIHAEGYAAGEMKHGPISLIDKDFPTIAIAPDDLVLEKMLSNMQEIKARGGMILSVTNESAKDVIDMSDDNFIVPKTIDILQPILNIIPLQLFAYYVAKERGCDIDKPRNLAKSVTVE